MDQSYSVAMENQTILADASLVIIRAATAYASRGSVLEILRISVSQQSSSTSQQLGVIVGQKASVFGTYVSATPQPMTMGTVASAIVGGTTAAAASCGVKATAEGAGTVTSLWSDGFNILNGYLWVPTPEERIVIGPDLAFLVKLRGTPNTLTGWNATVVFRELN